MKSSVKEKRSAWESIAWEDLIKSGGHGRLPCKGDIEAEA